MKRTVQEGDTVKVFYRGYFDDKTVFDSNEGQEPLKVEVGKGMLLKKFEEALIGMKEGESKDVTMKAEEGYGLPKAELRQEVPKDKIPKEAPLKEGVVLTLVSPKGNRMFATIREIKKDSIILDLNHPLAGKNLNFHIKLDKIE